jgi:hypothetical protein
MKCICAIPVFIRRDTHKYKSTELLVRIVFMGELWLLYRFFFQFEFLADGINMQIDSIFSRDKVLLEDKHNWSGKLYAWISRMIRHTQTFTPHNILQLYTEQWYLLWAYTYLEWETSINITWSLVNKNTLATYTMQNAVNINYILFATLRWSNVIYAQIDG